MEEQKWREIINYIKKKTTYRYLGFAINNKINENSEFANKFDTYFAICGDIAKENFYRRLLSDLAFNFIDIDFWITKSGNKLNVRGNQIKFDLILLNEDDFKKKIQQNHLKLVEFS
ncbi:MAG: hypothetical protein ACTSRZ_01660 [Promethearchaeota archaeon]